MTESMKFLPIPNEAFEEAGFTEEGLFDVEISNGKLTITQLNHKACPFPESEEKDCDECRFCCPNCGECLASEMMLLFEDLKRESEADDNA